MLSFGEIYLNSGQYGWFGLNSVSIYESGIFVVDFDCVLTAVKIVQAPNSLKNSVCSYSNNLLNFVVRRIFNSFHATVLSLYPLKTSQKTSGFLMFSGGIEKNQ